jgi:hypothetical protein
MPIKNTCVLTLGNSLFSFLLSFIEITSHDNRPSKLIFSLFCEFSNMCLFQACLFLLTLLVVCNGNYYNIDFLQSLTNIYLSSTGQCPYNATSLNIPNGYISDATNIRIDATQLVYGYLNYACGPGYALNPAIGGRLTCYASGTTGVWSTTPVCQCKSINRITYLYILILFLLATGRCTTAPVFAFILSPLTAASMTSNGSYYLPTDGTDNTTVISGAFVPMQCLSGYVNIGGPFNITCVGGTWTTLPNCVSNTGSGAMTTTTTMGTPASVQCSYDATTFTIANGFPSNTSGVLIYSNPASATGIQSKFTGVQVSFYIF